MVKPVKPLVSLGLLTAGEAPAIHTKKNEKTSISH
jgi:hypothetical protein